MINEHVQMSTMNRITNVLMPISQQADTVERAFFNLAQ